ncbi:MAG: OmpA family protein [Saprospiraceae bacterium]|nr:OmpA family protein [Saprospiraceae bacterium]
MRSLGLVILMVGGFVFLSSGQEQRENLVPNGSFEAYSSTPLGWFYTGADFTRVVKFWESPTAASPDVYGPKVFVPSQWKDKGFGEAAVHDGKSMVGLTLYGCEGGKPHCREYVQIQLTEPLVIGQRYALSFWTTHLPRSMRINNLGAAFVHHRISSPLDEALHLRPQVAAAQVIECENGAWHQVEATFTADSVMSYLILGNFATDAETEAKRCSSGDHLPYAYYYIDDVVMQKLPPILEVPVPANDLSRLTLTVGETFALHNIYFDHDRADFMPRSYRELNTLVDIMKKHATMRIEVKGHTDSVGTDAYNYQLSLARARAVVEYLHQHGIDPSRTEYSGYGSRMPLDSNTTETGRQKNRRVEFLVLEN